MKKRHFQTMSEFWPFYLRAHRHPLTRSLHFIGTTNLIVLLVIALWKRRASVALLALVSSYAWAWVGHFLVERNLPTTFRYPWKSALGDLLMYRRTWERTLQADLDRWVRGSS